MWYDTLQGNYFIILELSYVVHTHQEHFTIAPIHADAHTVT